MATPVAVYRRARPETGWTAAVMERYPRSEGQIIAEGRAIGHHVAPIPVKVIHDIQQMDAH